MKIMRIALVLVAISAGMGNLSASRLDVLYQERSRIVNSGKTEALSGHLHNINEEIAHLESKQKRSIIRNPFANAAPVAPVAPRLGSWQRFKRGLYNHRKQAALTAALVALLTAGVAGGKGFYDGHKYGSKDGNAENGVTAFGDRNALRFVNPYGIGAHLGQMRYQAPTG